MNKARFSFSIGIVLALILTPFGFLIQPAQTAAAALLWLFATPAGAGTTCAMAAPCSLNTAVAKATSGSTIYLGEGTYTNYNPSNTIDLDQDVNLYGGWYGSSFDGGILFPLRDPLNHPSIIDGRHSQRDLYIHGAITPIIDGLTFVNGYGSDAQKAECGAINAWACGGGIFSYQTTPTIQNCVFRDNIGFNEASIDENGYGGGIFVESPGGPVSIQNNLFDSNQATGSNYGDGGAIAMHGGPGIVSIKNNLFSGNIASRDGGAIAASLYTGPLVIANNRFEANHSSLPGAAISLNYVNIANIDQNYFTGQTSPYAMIVSDESGLTFSRNTMIDNSVKYGLDFYLSGSSIPLVVNNLLIRSGYVNSILVHGDGGTTGSGLLTVYFKHNTLVGNGTTPAVKVESNTDPQSSTVCTVTNCAHAVFENNILFKYTTGFDVPYSDKGKVTSYNTLFYLVTTKYTGYTLNNNEVTVPYAGFKDYLHDDYHLVVSAPARDKGMSVGVTLDFEGDPRPRGGGYDLGADEFAYHVLLPLLKK